MSSTRFVKDTNICELDEMCEVMIECNDCVLRTLALRASAAFGSNVTKEMKSEKNTKGGYARVTNNNNHNKYKNNKKKKNNNKSKNSDDGDGYNNNNDNNNNNINLMY